MLQYTTNTLGHWYVRSGHDTTALHRAASPGTISEQASDCLRSRPEVPLGSLQIAIQRTVGRCFYAFLSEIHQTPPAPINPSIKGVMGGGVIPSAREGPCAYWEASETVAEVERSSPTGNRIRGFGGQYLEGRGNQRKAHKFQNPKTSTRFTPIIETRNTLSPGGAESQQTRTESHIQGQLLE